MLPPVAMGCAESTPAGWLEPPGLAAVGAAHGSRAAAQGQAAGEGAGADRAATAASKVA